MKTYHAARYPYLWVQTTEEERLIRAHRAEIPEEIPFFSWDIADGFKGMTMNGAGWVWKPLEPDIQDPGAALGFTLEGIPENAIIFMKDFHKFFTDITVIRRAINIKDQLKATARMIVFVSASGADAIPAELQNDITVYGFTMPDRAQLEAAVKRVCEDNEIEAPPDLGPIINGLTGLTLEAAENALCKCLVEKKRFDAPTILDEKAAILKSAAGLIYARHPESFTDLYGLERMKAFCLGTIKSDLSRGILIYGVPGCGKSHFAKALANETGRPCLVADFNSLRGKFQGDAEGRVDMMFKTAAAFGPHVLFADEFDKSIAGSGSADTDGGVGQRILQKILVEGQDRAPGSYWVFTCNSLDDVLSLSGGALVRRFDAIFFVDMPSPAERKGIAEIWTEKLGVTIPADYDLEGFTGADIAKLVTTMKMMDTDPDTARQYLVPSSKSIGKKIEEIRARAQSVCIWANAPTETTTATKRRVAI